MGKNETDKPEWIPLWLRASWVRDWLCPLCLYIPLLSLWYPHSLQQWGWVVLCYGVLGGALSTYWSKLFGEDNFYLHGLGCGLAILPLITFIPWYILAGRLVVCTVGMGLWSKWVGNDVSEELGRGVLFIL